MRRILSQNFFKRDTVLVAKSLLGKFLVRRFGSRGISRMITEVEVYDGFRDRASHASRGKTARNSIMFGDAGRWYVYFTYGMHWMLNVVTREKDYPAAILIRAAEGFNGPAKLSKFLKIDKRFNGLLASKKSGLWIENRGYKLMDLKIKNGPRVGVGYAGPHWAKRKWRFFLNL